MQPPGENRRQVRRVLRAWPLWSLAEPLRSFVIATPAAAAALIAVLVSHASWGARDVLVLAGLAACALAATESTARLREVHGTLGRDLNGVWYIAAAVTLPPGLAVMLPIPVTAYRLWRVRSGVVHRRVFSCATQIIGYGAAAVLFGRVPRWFAGPVPAARGLHVLTWIAAVLGCAIIANVINNGQCCVALLLSDRKQRLRELFGNRATLAADMLDLSLGAQVTLVVAVNPALMAIALPAVVLCRGYVMRRQLAGPGRMGPPAGLLTEQTWRAEAEVMCLRAARAGHPLSIAVADIDEFRSVQEAAGEEVAAQLRKAVGALLYNQLRDQDLIGTYGNRGFILALPGMSTGEAGRCSQRLRDRIASEPLTVEAGAHAGFVFRLTVSLGVATVSQPDPGHAQLGKMVDAALSALGTAKDAGWNHVFCVSAGPAGQDPVSPAGGVRPSR